VLISSPATAGRGGRGTGARACRAQKKLGRMQNISGMDAGVESNERASPAFDGRGESGCQDASRMRQPGRYRDRVVERLRAVVESRGTSVATVEKRLKRGRGYVADALRGDKRLSVETILEVLAILEVPPEEFFERPWQPPWRSELAEPVPGGGNVAVGAMPASLRDASPTLQAVVLLLANKGLVSFDELQELQHELAPGTAIGVAPPPPSTR
jgi:transcriptional regulator with XRE-family HTH domain